MLSPASSFAPPVGVPTFGRTGLGAVVRGWWPQRRTARPVVRSARVVHPVAAALPTQPSATPHASFVLHDPNPDDDLAQRVRLSGEW